MGANGRHRVLTEFSVDRMVEGNLAVYEELLNRKDQGRGHPG